MRRQERPPFKAGEFGEFGESGKNGEYGKISPTTTWRPMQMRRQEGPLVKPANLANLANLAKMANMAKSRQQQLGGQCK